MLNFSVHFNWYRTSKNIILNLSMENFPSLL